MYEGAAVPTGVAAGVAVGYELGATWLVAGGIAVVLLTVLGVRIWKRLQHRAA
jgi:hypothetical protein